MLGAIRSHVYPTSAGNTDLSRLACFQAAFDGITPTFKQLQVPGDLKNMFQGLDATVKL